MIKKNKNKKAQIEIMGLVIIVVLISIGIFVFISLSKNIPKPTPIKKYSNDMVAQNYIQTLLETNVDCGGSKRIVQDLIKDCYIDPTSMCTFDKTNCEVLRNIINETLMNTFEIRDIKYELKIARPDIIFRKNCTSEMSQGRRGIQPIPITVTGEQTEIELGICD